MIVQMSDAMDQSSIPHRRLLTKVHLYLRLLRSEVVVFGELNIT
jgi:hypothetical protein